MPASLSVDGWSVGRRLQVTAVRYQITDARPPFPHSLSPDFTHCCTQLPNSILFGTRSLTANFQAVVLALADAKCHPLGICQCTVLQRLTLTQSSRGWQEGQQMILLSISGGRSTQRAAASTDSLTLHLPALPMLCL